MNLKDTRKTIPALILILLMIGLTVGVILVKRQQKAAGEATGLSPSPSFYLKQDYNRNGVIDEQDFLIFKQKFAAKDPSADLDGSGEVNGLDYNLFLSKMK